MKPPNVTSVLLAGPQDSHMSSFLMQGAVHYAEQGHTVIYISATELDRLPLPVHGLARPTPDVFSLIKFLYLPHWQDLLQHLFSLHLHSLVPSVLIVQALEHFFTDCGDTSICTSNATEASHAALICAALLDGASVCAKRSKRQTHVVVSINQESSQSNLPPWADIFFTDVVWLFERTKESAENVGSEEFSMTNLETAGSEIKQYKISFSPQSADGAVVVKRVSVWENIGKSQNEVSNSH